MRIRPTLCFLVALGIGGCALSEPRSFEGPLSGTRYEVADPWARDESLAGYWRELRQVYVNEHTDLRAATLDAILEGKVALGMTTDQARIAWNLGFTLTWQAEGFRTIAITEKLFSGGPVREQWDVGPWGDRVAAKLTFYNGILFTATIYVNSFEIEENPN